MLGFGFEAFLVVMAFLAIMRLASDLPISVAWQTLFVRPAVKRLQRITRGHVLLAGLLIALLFVLVWALETEGVQLMAMALPDVLAWASMFEVSTLIDAALATALVASGLRLGRVRAAVTTFRRPRQRRRRSLRQRGRARKAANDDEGHGSAVAVRARAGLFPAPSILVGDCA